MTANVRSLPDSRWALRLPWCTASSPRPSRTCLSLQTSDSRTIFSLQKSKYVFNPAQFKPARCIAGKVPFSFTRRPVPTSALPMLIEPVPTGTFATSSRRRSALGCPRVDNDPLVGGNARHTDGLYAAESEVDHLNFKELADRFARSAGISA